MYYTTNNNNNNNNNINIKNNNNNNNLLLLLLITTISRLGLQHFLLQNVYNKQLRTEVKLFDRAPIFSQLISLCFIIQNAAI